MAQLLDLPLELLNSISDEVRPADLDNYALVCKQLRAAAVKALSRHKILRQEYGNVGNHSDETRMVYLPDLLKTLIEEPHLAFYVRRFGLKGLAGYWGQPRRPKHSFMQDPACRQYDDMDHFVELLGETVIMPERGDDMEGWNHAFWEVSPPAP